MYNVECNSGPYANREWRQFLFITMQQNMHGWWRQNKSKKK